MPVLDVEFVDDACIMLCARSPTELDLAIAVFLETLTKLCRLAAQCVSAYGALLRQGAALPAGAH